MIHSAKLALLAGCLLCAGAIYTRAQEQSEQGSPEHRHPPKDEARVAQIVALDECDPTTFNAKLGPGFCKNIALGAFTTFSDLFKKAAAGTPDPNWDFEPDVLKVREGTNLSVVNQGGEPHTFTEVVHFGGGFINDLNGGEETVPECADGFSNLAVARTRILQGSTVHVTDLSKGKHHFQCCIHPWMRVTVDVK
ncbi:MAG TPA: hypothetical protein VH601_02010 [Bryobacteraceae bacterium]|jgi:plastocyanin